MCYAQQINLKRNQTQKNLNNMSKKLHCLWTMAFVGLEHLEVVPLIVMLDTSTNATVPCPPLLLAVNAVYVSNRIRASGKILQNQINTNMDRKS